MAFIAAPRFARKHRFPAKFEQPLAWIILCRSTVDAGALHAIAESLPLDSR